MCGAQAGSFQLKMHEPSHDLPGGFVQRCFQNFLGFLQFLSDGDALGAVLLAFAAADAVGGGGGIFAEGGAL